MGVVKEAEEVGVEEDDEGIDADAGVEGVGATDAKDEGGWLSPMSAGTRGERVSSVWGGEPNGLKLERPNARLEERRKEVAVVVVLEMGWLRG